MIKNRKVKNSKDLEKHFKGVANHWRIEIILTIAKNPGVNLDSISQKIGCNMKTLSEHTRRLVQAGLVVKKYKDQYVEHFLSSYGKIFVKFIKLFSYSQEYENTK